MLNDVDKKKKKSVTYKKFSPDLYVIVNTGNNWSFVEGDQLAGIWESFFLP